MAANKTPPISSVRESGRNRATVSLNVGRGVSVILDGARAVAGVAEVAAITGIFAVEVAGFSASPEVACSACFASVVPADATTEAAGDATATGVSTVGEIAGTATAGISDGFTGLPAALASPVDVAGEGSVETGDSLASEAIASIPAMAGVATGEVKERDPDFPAACLLAAVAVPGIGLGSIAGLASV